MSGKPLKRVLKTRNEEEHGLMDEAVKLYNYFQKLVKRANSTYEDVEKVDNLIYKWMKIIEIKFFQIIKPLAGLFYRNKNQIKNFKHKRENSILFQFRCF